MKRTRLSALLLASAFAAMTPQMAQAVGTPACTSIANTALVDYSVGSVAQPQESGIATPFVVGNKVNLEVVVGNASPGVSVVQGPTGGMMTFTVTNTGNKIQDYALSTVNLAAAQTAWAGITDEFDAGAATAYVESGATAGYQPLQDTALFIDELDPTVTYPNEATIGTRTVYVISAGPIPASAGNGDNALYGLIATTHRGGTSGGAIGALVVDGETGACSEDTVFADIAGTQGQDDAALDGKDSDRSGLVVSADATLNVTKTSAVYSDPINGISVNAKAIPGAIVTYTILIENPVTSTATANAITIADSLAGEIGAGHLAFNTQFDDGVDPCAAAEGIVIDGTCQTNASGDDDADFTANVVNAVGPSLAPNTSTTIKFQVTIQ